MMYIIRLLFRKLYLIFFLIKKHFFRNLLATSGLLITLIIVTIILGVIRPIKNQIIEQTKSILPSTVIKVTKKEKIKDRNPLFLMNFFDIHTDQQMGATRREVRQIRSWKEIESVGYTQILQIPMVGKIIVKDSIKNSIPGASNLLESIKFDLILQGIRDVNIKGNLKCMRNFRVSKYKAKDGNIYPLIPIVISEKIVNIVNFVVAVNQVTSLNKKAIIGNLLEVTLGRSLFRKYSGRTEKVFMKICGITQDNYTNLMSMPIYYVLKKHKEWGYKQASNSFDNLFIKIKEPLYIPKVQKKLKKMKFVVPTDTPTFNKFYESIKNIDIIAWSIVAILSLLAFISISSTFMVVALEKKYEFGLYLFFGSSMFYIWFLLFLEGFFWGSFYFFISIFCSEYIFDYIKILFSKMDALRFLVDFDKIQVQIASKEKIFLFLITSTVSGIATLIPGILMTKRNPLSMIRKD